MPTWSRPPILCLRDACHDAHENDAGRERRARSAAARHTCDDDEPWELVTHSGRPVHGGELGALAVRSMTHRLERGASQRPDGPRRDDILMDSRGWGSRDWVSTSSRVMGSRDISIISIKLLVSSQQQLGQQVAVEGHRKSR